MDSFKICIDLSRMQNAQVVTNKEGKKAILIPFEENDFFVTEKGRIMAFFTAWANRDGQVDEYGKSHSVKQSFGLKYIEAHPQFAQSQMIPFIGNMKPIAKRPTSLQDHSNDAPTQFGKSSTPTASASFSDSDIPF